MTNVLAATGPTWPQLIGTLATAVGLGSILSALVTGFFLMKQNQAQDRRETARLEAEDKRRREDREDERQKRAETRQHEVVDQWRARRYEAHAMAIGVLDEILRTVEDRMQDPKRLSPDAIFPSEQQDRLDDALANVRIVAGDDARHLGLEAGRAVRFFGNVTAMVDRNDGEALSSAREKRLTDMFVKARLDAIEAVQTYEAAARFELGTKELKRVTFWSDGTVSDMPSDPLSSSPSAAPEEE